MLLEFREAILNQLGRDNFGFFNKLLNEEKYENNETDLLSDVRIGHRTSRHRLQKSQTRSNHAAARINAYRPGRRTWRWRHNRRWRRGERD
jgi:hypothetical protein